MGEHLKDKRALKGVKKLIELQVVIAGMSSLLFFILAGKYQALSALAGGFIAIVPNLLLARKLFQHQGARAAGKIVKSFYLGEAIKFLSTLVLFALVFKYTKAYPLAIFITYILVLMTYWFSPLIFDNKQNRPESD